MHIISNLYIIIMRKSDEGYMTSHHLKWGPLPPNDGRIAQPVREGKKGKDGEGCWRISLFWCIMVRVPESKYQILHFLKIFLYIFYSYWNFYLLLTYNIIIWGLWSKIRRYSELQILRTTFLVILNICIILDSKPQIIFVIW